MTLPKLVIFLTFLKVALLFHKEFSFYFSMLFYLVGLLSIIIGTFFALNQKKLRRFLAYSGIVNLGLVFLVVAPLNEMAAIYALFYLIIYLILTFNLFAWIFVFRKVDKSGHLVFFEEIDDFMSLVKISPVSAFLISFVFFSYAGIPPFLGFFSKFYLLSFLVKNGFIFLAIFVLVFSAIALLYYLFFIQLMFFSKEKHKNIVFCDTNILYLAIFLSLVNLFGFFFVDFFFSVVFLLF